MTSNRSGKRHENQARLGDTETEPPYGIEPDRPAAPKRKPRTNAKHPYGNPIRDLPETLPNTSGIDASGMHNEDVPQKEIKIWK